ncbi:MAG: hypothetical protein ABI821_11605 [Pseudomonadota bacterium]
MSKAFACVVLALAVALPLAACGGEKPPMKTGIGPPTRIPDVAAPAGPAGVAVTSASIPRAVRRAVVADAARRFKVAESAVVLTQTEKVTWSDASLGCPEPGQMYAQMLVDGFRIVAKTDAGSLAYNTDSGGKVVSCAAAQRPGVNSATPPMMDTEPQPYPPPPAPEK